MLPRYLDQVSQARCRPGSHTGAEQGQAGPLGPGQDLSSDLLWVVWPWPGHQLLCSPLRETEGWGLSPGAPCLSLVILTSVPTPTLPDPNLTRAELVLPLSSAPGGLPAPHPAQLEPWHNWVRPGKGGVAPGRQAARWALRLGPQREPPFVHPPSQSCFAVVLGGPQETGRLLEHKFDYIFFTGEGPAAGGRLGGTARDGRSERPEASSGPCPQLLERGSEDRGRQPAREDTGVSSGGCARLQDKQPGEWPWTPGTLGELGPIPRNRPLHQSQFHTSQHPPLLSELRLCQALPHHPPALLDGWTDEGPETWVTKRCSAHLTSQGWGRLDFAPRGHLPSSWHVPMGPRHHLASGDQGRVPRREERMEEADSHVSGPGPGGGRPDLPPPQHTSSLAGEAVSASLLPRPCREPGTRPANRHCNRQGRRWGERRGRVLSCSSRFPGQGEYQEEAAGGAHHPPSTHLPLPHPEAQWALGPGPLGPRVQRRGRQTPEASVQVRPLRQSVQGPTDHQKALCHIS